jgi:hypothetical protein
MPERFFTPDQVNGFPRYDDDPVSQRARPPFPSGWARKQLHGERSFPAPYLWAVAITDAIRASTKETHVRAMMLIKEIEVADQRGIGKCRKILALH